MGVEPFLLSSAMKMVISQRLAKRMCPFCKKEKVLSEPIRKKVEEFLKPIMEEEELKKLVFYE
jgi:type IV pilus assembly protein PilB